MYTSTALTPLNQPTLHKGGGLKAALGIAAAIAIPIAAPAIAGSIGTSLGIASIGAGGVGTAFGSALVGGALGGISGYALGGGTKGALLGAAGGAFGGYLNAPSPATATATPTNALASSSASSAGGVTSAAPSSSAGLVTGGAPSTINGVPVNAQGFIPGTTFTPQGGQSFIGSATAPSGGFTSITPQGGMSFPAGTVVNGAASATPITMSAPIPAAGGGFTGATSTVLPSTASFGTRVSTGISDFTANLPGRLADAGGKALSAITDPNNIAKAGFDFGSRALADKLVDAPDLTPEQKALLEAQTAGLRTLQGRDQQVFGTQLAGAQGLISNADYYNPEYQAQQAAITAKNAGARAKQAGLRELSPNQSGSRAAEERRYNLANTRGASTAYQQGLGQGIRSYGSQKAAGLSSLPSAGSAYLSALNNVGTGADRRAAALQKERANATGFLNNIYAG